MVEDILPWPEGMVELTKSGDLEGDKIRRLPVGGSETSRTLWDRDVRG